jgi:hypothetical protein
MLRRWRVRRLARLELELDEAGWRFHRMRERSPRRRAEYERTVARLERKIARLWRRLVGTEGEETV